MFHLSVNTGKNYGHCYPGLHFPPRFISFLTSFFFLYLDINYRLDFSFHFTTVKAKIALDKPKQTRKTLVKAIAIGEKDQNCV